MSSSTRPSSEATKKIQAIVLAAWNAEPEETQCKSKLDDVKQIAYDAGLGFYQEIQPEFVGVHPDNGGGAGVWGIATHELGKEIVDGGWSQEETFGATCFEDIAERKRNELIVKK